MLTSLHLTNFKNFQDAALPLGPFTLIVGANATGKSNLRDAFRFLHGIGRGYSLADIIGEKYGPGGERQWPGIRGGIREITFTDTEEFGVRINFYMADELVNYSYSILMEYNTEESKLSIVDEMLMKGDTKVFYTPALDFLPEKYLPIEIDVPDEELGSADFRDHEPTITQISELDLYMDFIGEDINFALGTFSSMRFFDFVPDEMRKPSFPGQDVLGDRGENLASVLKAICENPEDKQTLLTWLQELTPMDAADFEFPTDFTGKILLVLVEKNGQKISAYSASDGTLRFLGIIAALLGSNPAKFTFWKNWRMAFIRRACICSCS